MQAQKRVVVVGSGAREHALARALVASRCEVVVAPGNAGTEAIGRNAAVRADDVEGQVDLAVREKADLVVVGPEAPLVVGLVDALAARGIRAFGPTRAAAQLEGSKAFMKRFCERHGIPTAPFAVFGDADAAERHLRQHASPHPLVVKADGLAAGKGVVVPDSVDEACAAVDRFVRRRELGDAGATVVLEERLPGEEASFHVVCDGSRGVALAPAQDHKRVHDGDRGPNTGGMGAYAPAPVVTAEVQARVMREIVEPTLAGMAADGTPFRGALFVGLMIERGVPRVLEFNVRFGDPETSVLVPTYAGDWFELLDASARGDLSAVAASGVGRARGAALAVVMAAEGYPGKPRSGDRVEGLDAPLPGGAFVLHAGTAR
ncbi:MAG TPA: phosphoribosylamine--glycine ligase, partial [Polyangiaceae bacterium]|nr:phosphoribosylamine--glycine ligase [Polyangiaceae bacterium]